MEAISETLRAINDGLASRVATALASDVLREATDDELFAVLTASAEMVRRAEAAIIEATTHVQDRSTSPVKADRTTTRAQCGSVRELVQRCTRSSNRRVRSYERLASALRRDVSITSGELLPGAFPHLHDALVDGEVGADGLEFALTPVQQAAPRLSARARQVIDASLAAHTRGVAFEALDAANPGDLVGDTGSDGDGTPGAESAKPVGELHDSADALRARAQLLVQVLDQDGAEPREEAAKRKRGLTVGPERDGLVSVRGNLMPEVGAQLKLILDSITNPKVRTPEFLPTRQDADAWHQQRDDQSIGGAGDASGDTSGDARGADSSDPRCANPGDDRADDLVDERQWFEERTRPQQLHDAFANAMTVLARSGELPQIGGAAPTLVVSVRAEDLDANRGWAHVQGTNEPVAISVARHIACTGQVQRVTQGENGRILDLGITDRIFNAHQRRAILARDGGCVIPGCETPASWCEIHHVHEHARGGPTHTDNGVAVCWHHHRMLGSDGWDIRMTRGSPEVRAPARWDARRHWRPATKSRVRPFRPPDRHAG